MVAVEQLGPTSSSFCMVAIVSTPFPWPPAPPPAPPPPPPLLPLPKIFLNIVLTWSSARRGRVELGRNFEDSDPAETNHPFLRYEWGMPQTASACAHDSRLRPSSRKMRRHGKNTDQGRGRFKAGSGAVLGSSPRCFAVSCADWTEARPPAALKTRKHGAKLGRGWKCRAAQCGLSSSCLPARGRRRERNGRRRRADICTKAHHGARGVRVRGKE